VYFTGRVSGQIFALFALQEYPSTTSGKQKRIHFASFTTCSKWHLLLFLQDHNSNQNRLRQPDPSCRLSGQKTRFYAAQTSSTSINTQTSNSKDDHDHHDENNKGDETNMSISLNKLKREFHGAMELYQVNRQTIPANIDAILEDLEREASDPSFWDATGATATAPTGDVDQPSKQKQKRIHYVASQLNYYRRLQQRRNQWQSWERRWGSRLGNVTTTTTTKTRSTESDEENSPLVPQTHHQSLTMILEERQSLLEELQVGAMAEWSRR
jgi:hypothetical protein